MFTFAWIFYLVLTLATFFLFVGLFWTPLVLLGACLHCVGVCSHIALIIVIVWERYSAMGRACADIGNAEDASTIEDLLISQIVLFTFYYCCIGVTCEMSLITVTIKRKAANFL